MRCLIPRVFGTARVGKRAPNDVKLALMNSVAGPVEPQSDLADSPNVRVVKEAFGHFDEGNVEAGIEQLLSHAHADLEFRPYVAAGQVLRGPAEVRAFFRGKLEGGTSLVPRPSSFEDGGDEVVVNGSLRVVGPAGGFAETQLSWTYRFREGRIEEVRWGPRRPAVIAHHP
jgi:ketosteroid isomerase-like protein